MAEPRTNDDPHTSGTVVVGVVGAILVFAVIVALQALFYNVESAETVSKVYDVGPDQLNLLRADQLERLHSYRWIDHEQGVVGIPIDLAMKLVADELGGESASAERPGGSP
jgi:hypothetical protein